MTEPVALRRPPPETWRLPKPLGWQTIVILVLALALVARTGADVGIGEAARATAASSAAAIGIGDDTQVADAVASIALRMWPPQLHSEIDTARIANFDRNHLPVLAYLEIREARIRTLDPHSMKPATRIEQREILIQPFGYVIQVCLKLIETLEIAFWGTIIAIVLGAPLALMSARGFVARPPVTFVARAIVALMRAVPELITALFFVLAFGFGPVAGVLALALHAAGFLGKFYAEDIENADPGPKEALIATGASRFNVLRHATLPQVMPQYVGYTLYILDRNVRMATVIGLVGAGGIGQELKGRYDLYDYGHVATILIAIFLLVLALDQVAARLRAKMI